MMPGKKDFVSVLGADGKSPSTKETTALHAYSEFKVHHDGLKVGFSKFAQLQPKECIIAVWHKVALYQGIGCSCQENTLH